MNMYDMSLTAEVLNNGTVWRLEHPLNMYDMLVTTAVLNNGTVWRL